VSPPPAEPCVNWQPDSIVQYMNGDARKQPIHRTVTTGAWAYIIVEKFAVIAEYRVSRRGRTSHCLNSSYKITRH